MMPLGGPSRPFLATQAHWVGFALAMLVLLAHSQRFFPMSDGRIGHDYAYFLPYLLAGRYWAEVNGYLSIPDAIAAICGGMPWFANPQSMYFSLPQWLAFVVDPVVAVWLTYLLSCLIGALGTYLLCRRTFLVSVPGAVMTAALFLLSGMLEARLVAGHLPYHALTVLPWMGLATLAMPSANEGVRSSFRVLAGGCAVALGMAYMVYAGIPHIVPHAGLGLLILVCTHALRFGPTHAPLLILALGVLISLPLAAPKLLPAAQWMATFPEGGALTLGLAPATLQGAWLLFAGLFVPGLLPSSVALAGSPYAFGAHELDYSVSLVPALLFVLFALRAAFGRLQRPARSPPFGPGVLPAISLLLLALFLIPLALSFGNAAWSATLRGLPFLGSGSVGTRWWLVWAVPLLVWAALAFDALGLSKLRRPSAALVLVSIAAVQTFVAGPDWVVQPPLYDPALVRKAARELDRTHDVVPVTRVGSAFLSDPATGAVFGPNDGVAVGYSSYLCYDPMFGYDLRNLPFRGPGHTVRIDEVANGSTWLMNPGCFLAPNTCAPGQRLPAEDWDVVLRFVGYQRLPPGVMPDQRAVRLIGAMAWIVVLLILAAWVAWAMFAARAMR